MPTPSRSYSPSATETLRVALLALAATATTGCSVSEQILDTLRDTALGRALGLSISVGGDPVTVSVPDSDGDGLSDRYELETGTDPYNPDSDSDGHTDGEEVMRLGTDPLKPNPADETDAPAS